MVLEATILCLDNSDWTRNGDYYPSRFQTQVEAANLIIENRCETNPENTLGIMTMAGKRVEMISTLTNDESRLLGATSNIPLNGECDITSALSIAILCLKHRINKNQKQRIILFVGSPVQAKPENLVQIGKKLKSGKAHDGRSPDYDDWELNGDILLWFEPLQMSIELSSMGIRVDKESLEKQLKEAGAEDRKGLLYHKMLLNGELPLTVGGGLGQSRICMYFMKTVHIGEVQSSIWPEEMVQEFRKKGIEFL